MIAGFGRGLSVRDVENTLADALGAEAALSKSTVSRICQAIGDKFTAWAGRHLDSLQLDYLFLDASMFKMHPAARAEPGARRVGHHYRRRAGVRRAGRGRQRVPATAQDEIRAAYWAIFDTDALTTAGARPGHKLVTAVQARIDTFAQTYGTLYPAAVKCLPTDREQLTSYLRFPTDHHKRIRHSNFIERTFGETRRRVKVIGRLPGETSCLNLVWAVLDRASRGWRGVNTTNTGPRLLHDLRRQLLGLRPAAASRLSAAALAKFDTVPGEERIFDNGATQAGEI